MHFKSVPEFDREYKKLKKKYRSLDDDLALFRKVVSKVPLGVGRHSAILRKSKNVCVIKTRLFCKYLKGSSFRLIYIYNRLEDTVIFVELYYKGNKKREDGQRIKRYVELLVS